MHHILLNDMVRYMPTKSCVEQLCCVNDEWNTGIWRNIEWRMSMELMDLFIYPCDKCMNIYSFDRFPNKSKSVVGDTRVNIKNLQLMNKLIQKRVYNIYTKYIWSLGYTIVYKLPELFDELFSDIITHSSLVNVSSKIMWNKDSHEMGCECTRVHPNSVKCDVNMENYVDLLEQSPRVDLCVDGIVTYTVCGKDINRTNRCRSTLNLESFKKLHTKLSLYEKNNAKILYNVSGLYTYLIPMTSMYDNSIILQLLIDRLPITFASRRYVFVSALQFSCKYGSDNVIDTLLKSYTYNNEEITSALAYKPNDIILQKLYNYVDKTHRGGASVDAEGLSVDAEGLSVDAESLCKARVQIINDILQTAIINKCVNTFRNIICTLPKDYDFIHGNADNIYTVISIELFKVLLMYMPLFDTSILHIYTSYSHNHDAVAEELIRLNVNKFPYLTIDEVMRCISPTGNMFMNALFGGGINESELTEKNYPLFPTVVKYIDKSSLTVVLAKIIEHDNTNMMKLYMEHYGNAK